MVTVDYFGRLGNNMFQYALGRIIAMQSGLRLDTEWNRSDFLESTGNPSGDEVRGGMIVVTDNPLPRTLKFGKEHVHLHGYFQDAALYNNHRDLIRNFWKLPKVEKNTKDLVVHLRLTDYFWTRNECVISPMWYQSIIKREQYRKLYVVVEPHCTNKKYLSFLKQFNPVIVSQSPKEDFEFLMSFDRIVCSNSTFAWWAAFLSDASKVYLFKKWMGLDRKGCLNLVNMAGATVLDGNYYRDRRYEMIDWTNYWEKPESYFKV
jgi:hypothetical protein